MPASGKRTRSSRRLSDRLRPVTRSRVPGLPRAAVETNHGELWAVRVGLPYYSDSSFEQFWTSTFLSARSSNFGIVPQLFATRSTHTHHLGPRPNKGNLVFSPLFRRVTAGAAAVGLALALAACSASGPVSTSKQSSSASTGSAEAGAFPVTIKSALGSATITEAPQRVVTIGWGSAGEFRW